MGGESHYSTESFSVFREGEGDEYNQNETLENQPQIIGAISFFAIFAILSQLFFAMKFWKMSFFPPYFKDLSYISMLTVQPVSKCYFNATDIHYLIIQVNVFQIKLVETNQGCDE